MASIIHALGALVCGGKIDSVPLQAEYGKKPGKDGADPIPVYVKVNVPHKPTARTLPAILSETVAALASLPLASQWLSVKIPPYVQGLARLKLSASVLGERLHVYFAVMYSLPFAKHLTRACVESHLSAMGADIQAVDALAILDNAFPPPPPPQEPRSEPRPEVVEALANGKPSKSKVK